MTDLTGRRRGDSNPENSDHVTVDWVLRVIGEMLKKFADDKDCDNNCPAMRELQQKVKDNDESLKMVWKKVDWIIALIITTLLAVLFK
ncbi:MAG: hypothetical protein WC748_09940 [Legionellales bacterium]|jgi:hypothetical protein